MLNKKYLVVTSKMPSRALLFFFLFLIGLNSACSKTNYQSAKAVVVDTKHRHWAKGFYELDVYYLYFNGERMVIAHSTAEGKERKSTARYHPGDSLDIYFNPMDSADTFIRAKIYTKPLGAEGN